MLYRGPKKIHIERVSAVFMKTLHLALHTPLATEVDYQQTIIGKLPWSLKNDDGIRHIRVLLFTTKLFPIILSKKGIYERKIRGLSFQPQT